VAGSIRVAAIAVAALLLVRPAAGQLQFGEFSTNLNGTVSAGYTGDYGNQTSSTHGWTLGGAGNFSGFYYNPNFVSFDVAPYLNQSRSNSDYQSISDASGVNFSSTVFGGSHFPGTISYAKAYNSEGTYAIPGISSFTTRGDSDTLGINWSANLPDAPSVSVGFQMGSSQYSVYGTDDEGNSAFHSFNIHSAYTLLGFHLGAYYDNGGAHSLFPQITDVQQESETHSNTSGYGFNVGHEMPLHGSFFAGVNRTNVDSDYLGYNYNGTIDTIDTAVAVQPTDKLHLSANADYSDNLTGQLYQAVIAAGGVVPESNANQESHSMDFTGSASYTFLPNLQTTAFAERRVQYFLGQNYGGNSYGGSASYGHGLAGGTLNVAGTLSDNTVDHSNVNALGFSTNVNYSRTIQGWKVSGSFGYAQNVQTLLVTYMTSFYNYSGNVRRRWGRLTFSAGATAGRTGLTEQPGTDNRSNSYTTSLGFSRWITATGTYSKSSGIALQTGNGLAPVPIPSPILPENLLTLYGGRSYSIGLASSPAKRLTISASYGKANSNFFLYPAASANENDEFNAIVQYQFRKMYLTGGVSRLEQGFSASGLPPQMISSFYIGVSRWFNFF
jgi:hypothetical protein